MGRHNSGIHRLNVELKYQRLSIHFGMGKSNSIHQNSVTPARNARYEQVVSSLDLIAWRRDLESREWLP